MTSPEAVAAASAMLRGLHVADPILSYIRELGAATRTDERLRLGASTRALRGLVAAAQVRAATQGRHYVVPSDVQQLAVPVLGHRMVLTRDALLDGAGSEDIVTAALARVEAPRPVPA